MSAHAHGGSDRTCDCIICALEELESLLKCSLLKIKRVRISYLCHELLKKQIGSTLIGGWKDIPFVIDDSIKPYAYMFEVVTVDQADAEKKGQELILCVEAPAA